MNIYKVDKITPEILDAFKRLIPQLSGTLKAPSQADLEAVIKAEGNYLFMAEIDGEIVGTTTLLINVMVSGIKARIEDVIVDTASRGQGVAMQLMQVAIACAKECGVEKLDLTSGPHRQAAHRLYEKCGFVKRDTYVFRLDLV